MLTHSNSIMFIQGPWGWQIPRYPIHWSYVYLIHFHRVIGNSANRRGTAGHYLGSTSALEYRLQNHRNGNGAALMRAVSEAGISWELARLWRFDSYEQARAWEKRLKKRGHNPQQCPRCNPHQIIDPYTFMRQGHSPLLSRPPGKRRPMQACTPCFVRWAG